MATKELSISFTELARMEIYCAKCDAASLINLANEKQIFGNMERCAVCMEPISERVRTAIAAYSRFFAEASTAKAKINFRIEA